MYGLQPYVSILHRIRIEGDWSGQEAAGLKGFHEVRQYNILKFI